MGFFNSVMQIGRLVRNAEMKMSRNGSAIVSFSIGVSELYKDEKGNFTTRPNFFDVVMFGKYVQACMPSLTKGREVAIKGRLRQERWEKDGKHYARVVIYADDLQILREPKGNKSAAELPAETFEQQAMEAEILEDPNF